LWWLLIKPGEITIWLIQYFANPVLEVTINRGVGNYNKALFQIEVHAKIKLHVYSYVPFNSCHYSLYSLTRGLSRNTFTFIFTHNNGTHTGITIMLIGFIYNQFISKTGSETFQSVAGKPTPSRRLIKRIDIDTSSPNRK
jgi:hypothetical protein